MKEKKRTLSSIRNEIQLSHLLLIIIITILFSLGGIAINVNAYDKSLNQNLQNMAELVSHLYSQVEDRSVEELRDYFARYSWYQPIYKDANDMFTDLQINNVQYIKKLEGLSNYYQER